MRDLINLIENAQSTRVRIKDGREITINHLESFDDGLHCLEVFADLDGELVGDGKYDMETGQFRGIEVPKAYRRLGIANAIYDYVEAMGLDVTPSPYLQPDGVAFWNGRMLRKVNEDQGEPSWVTQAFDLPSYGRQTFDIGGVDLQVAAMGVELKDDEQPLGIKHIEVPLEQRGQGKASAILRALVAGANARGRPLELSAYPYEERRETGKATPEQVAALVSFYERFGFVAKGANYNHPVTMIYRPTVTEAVGGKTPIPLDLDPEDGHCVAFDEGDHIFLNALYASRKGGGARMLQKVIDYATARALPVELLADGDDRLVAYYESFGFEMIGWEQNLMRLETVGLGPGSKPAQTLDGCVTYDARDGHIVAEFEEDEDASTGIAIKAVHEARPGGAERLRDAVTEFGRTQLYRVHDETN